MLHNTVRTAKQALLNNAPSVNSKGFSGSGVNSGGSLREGGSLRQRTSVTAAQILPDMPMDVQSTEFSRRRERAHDIVKQEFRMKKAQIAMMQSGGWRRRVFGIGKQQAGLPGSRLIHPYSPFAQIFTLLSAAALVYSALVSSFMVGFLWNAESCDKPPTLEIDVAVDCFFIVEIFVNFFIGIIREGEYCDDIQTVVQTYLRKGFLFDCVTSIPVSFLELVIWNACQRGEERNNNALDNGFRIVRTLKPLKIARLLRTLKFSRMTSIFNYISDYMRMPPFVVRAFKILLFICLLVHSSACCFWLIKEVSNTQEQIDSFLKFNGLKDGLQGSLFHKYIVAFYFVNTVFCTIGFGDIHAANTPERIFCVALFYIGVLVFGSLLAEIQDAVNKVRAASRERENQISTMVEFLRQKDVPLGLEKSIVRWTEFSLKNAQRHQAQELVMDMVPESLFWKLAQHLHHGLLLQIPLFEEIPDYIRDDLTLDIWCKMKPDIFSPYFPIATSRHPLERLFVVMSGTVILQEDGDVITTLHPGSWFGEYTLLGFSMFSDKLYTESQYVAITNVMCLYITKEDFETVMKSYPEDIKLKMTKSIQSKQSIFCDETESGSAKELQAKMKASMERRRSSISAELADDALGGIMRQKKKSQRARARWRELSRQLIGRNRRDSATPYDSEKVQFFQRATRGFIFGGSKETMGFDANRSSSAAASFGNDNSEGKKEHARGSVSSHDTIVVEVDKPRLSNGDMDQRASAPSPSPSVTLPISHSATQGLAAAEPPSLPASQPLGQAGSPALKVKRNSIVDGLVASASSQQGSQAVMRGLPPLLTPDAKAPRKSSTNLMDANDNSTDEEVTDGLRDTWLSMSQKDVTLDTKPHFPSNDQPPVPLEEESSLSFSRPQYASATPSPANGNHGVSTLVSKGSTTSGHFNHPAATYEELSKITQRLDDQQVLLQKQDEKLEMMAKSITTLTELVQQMAVFNMMAEA